MDQNIESVDHTAGVYSVVKVFTVLSRCIRCCQGGMTFCQVDQNFESVNHTAGVYSVVKVI